MMPILYFDMPEFLTAKDPKDTENFNPNPPVFGEERGENQIIVAPLFVVVP